MLEELAVGAQHRIPYVHVLVNNAYLGLIRQAQRGLRAWTSRSTWSSRTSTRPQLGVYGVDHVKVAEGLGCKAIRVTEPDRAAARLRGGQEAGRRAPGPGRRGGDPGARSPTSRWAAADIADVNEFEELATEPGHAPTEILPLAL